MKNSVVADLLDDAVEGVGVNTYSSPVLVKVAVAPVLKEVQLRRLLDGGIMA